MALSALSRYDTSRVEHSFTQTTHGFSVKDAIYHTGSAWAKAQADSENTLALGIVTKVDDTNNFRFGFAGVHTLASHGLTPGQYYFLSSTVAGDLVTTQPATYSNPVLYVLDADTVIILPYRPLLTATGDASGGGGGVSSSVIRITGFTSKGATNTFIMRIPTPTEVSGDTGLVTITDSASDGGYITVSKAAKIDVAWAAYNTSGAAQNVQLMVGANLVNSCNQTETELRKSGFIFNNSYPVAIATSVWLAPGEKMFFTAPFTPNATYPLLSTLTIGATF